MSRRAQMLIIADDLSGAADCAVGCTNHGLHAVVALGDDGAEIDADVLAVDGDTRRLQPEHAAQEAARLLRKHCGDGTALLYRKFDSTLRGHVGAELARTIEVRRAMNPDHGRVVAVFAPAFPAAGRTTIDGQQLLHGRPLEETAIAHLEDSAVSSDVCALMERADLRAALVGLSQIRGEVEALRNSMRAMANDVDVLVCDAETDEDLSIVAEASMILGRGTVWAGSAGLARFLPRAAGLTGSRADLSRRTFVTQPALFVVGSGSPTSREQAELLAARSDTIDVRIPPEILLAGKQSLEWRDYQLRIESALNQRRDLVVLPEAGPQLDRSMGIKLAASLAELVRPFAGVVGSLVVTGGETARAVFDAWGINRLHIVGEVEPGLPFSLTSGWSRELAVLTKAGGFGSAETFLRCRAFLSGLERGIGPFPGLRARPEKNRT